MLYEDRYAFVTRHSHPLAGRQRPAQIAVSSVGQIVDLLQHSDHAAVIAARTHADKVLAYELPFQLPGYRMLLCWDARAASDAGLQWLKAELLAIFRALPA